MSLFRYQALTSSGKKVTGVIDADSFEVAKERLKKERIMVIQLTDFTNRTKEIVLSSKLKLSFTRELKQLLKAGLPLYESLLTIEEKYRKTRVHPLFLDLCDQLKSGHSLSSALENYPKTFDPIYLAMIKAAEQTGSLPQIFDQLATMISKQQKLKKTIMAAITYPAFLASFCFIVVNALLFFVIPSMSPLFEGRDLHPFTSFVFSVSKFACDHVLSIFTLLFVSIASLILFLKGKKGRLHVERLLLKTPFISTFIVQAALVRFCDALSSLITGGIPLLEAIRLSKKTLKSDSFETLMTQTEKSVAEGESFTAEMKRSALMPTLVIRMLSLSEETGDMAPMLKNIAEIYEDEVEKNIAQATAILQPALLLTLGLIIGAVLLSLLIPLSDTSSLINI